MYKKAAHKTLVNMTPGVNITNILCAAFTHVRFLCLSFRFVLYWCKTVDAKAACRTLVKLTPGCDGHFSFTFNDFTNLSFFLFKLLISSQAHPNPSGNWSEWILSKLRLPNLMYEDVPNKPLDYYTCPFKTSKLDK